MSVHHVAQFIKVVSLSRKRCCYSWMFGGVGNRSMFRNILDLMFRSGYMIRDYLSGMQSAYFPPFKMFFLLTAFFYVVEHGFSLGTDDNEKQMAVQTEMVKQEQQDKDDIDVTINGIRVNASMQKTANYFCR